MRKGSIGCSTSTVFPQRAGCQRTVLPVVMSLNGNMKKVISLFFVVLFAGLIPFSAHADPINVDVPNNCVVTDTSDVLHTFPQSDSPSTYLGVCLLQTAKDAGLVNFTLTNDPSFGLYIQSVNGIP